MRLRRETGDFQIVVTMDADSGDVTSNSIRPGLSAEDLIGEVALVNDILAVIILANQTDAETVTFTAMSARAPITLEYHKATGEISKHAGTAQG